MPPPAPSHPYRVRSRGDGPPLTEPQRTVLGAVVHLCPIPGRRVTAAVVARSTDIRVGSVIVVLRSLAAKQLVHAEGDAAAPGWTPTMIGRARARLATPPGDARAAAARPAR